MNVSRNIYLVLIEPMLSVPEKNVAPFLSFSRIEGMKIILPVCVCVCVSNAGRGIE